jgi:hypothetical protein
VWDYTAGVLYKNTQPYQMQMDEGRVSYSNNNWINEFEYRDHQNNLRVGFKADNGQLLQTQQVETDAFGLEIRALSNSCVGSNNYKFQKQERLDDFDINLNWFKYRPQDPQIGRMWQVDALADKYVHNSVYAFSENKLTAHIELDGLEAVRVDKTIENLIIIVQGRATPTNDRATPGRTQVDNIVGGSVRDNGLGAINVSSFPKNSHVITYSGTDSDITPNDIYSTVYDYKARQNPDGKVFMIGHSQGAENIEEANRNLNSQNINVDLTITLDPASAEAQGRTNIFMSPNVKNAINISAKPTGDFIEMSGGIVKATNNTNVYNFQATSSQIGHRNIDNTYAPVSIKLINSYISTSKVNTEILKRNIPIQNNN